MQGISKPCKERWASHKGLHREDAEVIAMYTFDFGPENYEMNPYRMVNRELI